MGKWSPRGLVFAAAMIAVRLTQSVLINAFPTQAGKIIVGVLLLGAPWAILWGVIDGRADAHANPDPDRREDLPMTWLLAGLLAGVGSGALCWIISLFYKGLYVGALVNELTTFAAFTALIVFVPAVAGVAIGRLLVDRGYAKKPVRHHGLAAIEAGQADTDVFAAVSVGAQAGGPASAAQVADGEATSTDIPAEGENPATS